jgi:hypothetical protein
MSQIGLQWADLNKRRTPFFSAAKEICREGQGVATLCNYSASRRGKAFTQNGSLQTGYIPKTVPSFRLTLAAAKRMRVEENARNPQTTLIEH